MCTVPTAPISRATSPDVARPGAPCYSDRHASDRGRGAAAPVSGRVIPFRRPAREPEDPRQLAELTRARDQSEALVIQGLLEAHGIRVLLRTRVAQSVHPFTVGEQGEVQILVPRGELVEGRRLLARFAPGPSFP